MKPTELMIGDLYYWEAEGKKYPLQVTKETFALADEDIANFQPIPLTVEILEKNGFVCETWMPYWYIPYCHNLPYIEIFNNTEFVKDTDEGFIIHIQYVHELQHLLKLFKIEKEIVL